jgi:hypothetical protein
MAQVAYYILATIWKREVFHQTLATVSGSTLSFTKSEEALGLWSCYCSPQVAPTMREDRLTGGGGGWSSIDNIDIKAVWNMYTNMPLKTGSSCYILIARKQLQLSGAFRSSIPRTLMSYDILIYQNYCIAFIKI